MTAKVILNPYAGRWEAQQRKGELESALHEAGINFDLVSTNGPGQGIELAFQAVREGFDPIIAAGGDGTYSEVINGVAQATENGGVVSLGIVPLGTANDLVDNLGIPSDITGAVDVIANGQIQLMDLCSVNERYFDNNAAIGLEPYVTTIQQRMKRLKGNLRYITATLAAIMQNPKWDMHLEWEGGEYSGPVTLVSVGNSPRTGGIFYMAPHANPFDGLLTFVHGFLPTRLQILSVLPRTTKPGEGSFVEHSAVYEISSPWLRVRSQQPTPAHADGEIFAEAIQELYYKVYPGRLPILLDKNPYIS
jgi:diacylglycerol kinase (ATP)